MVLGIVFSIKLPWNVYTLIEEYTNSVLTPISQVKLCHVCLKII